MSHNFYVRMQSLCNYPFVKRRYSVTPLYGHLVIYDHFLSTMKTAWTSTVYYENPSLMRSPVNTANGHILKSLTVESFIISPR